MISVSHLFRFVYILRTLHQVEYCTYLKPFNMKTKRLHLRKRKLLAIDLPFKSTFQICFSNEGKMS